MSTERNKHVRETLRALGEADTELETLNAIHDRQIAAANELAQLAVRLSHSIPDSESELAQAWDVMREANMSFNLQYLQLQNAMQDESRQFTLVSDIVKTQHDAAKNSISNLR